MRDKALRDAREEKEELEALHRLDEECVHQQRAVRDLTYLFAVELDTYAVGLDQGNYLKAFDCMERALVLRRHFFGLDSEEVVQACRALAEMCNLLAMSFLQKDKYAVTIDLLKKAEVLTQRHHPAERATTLNNLACYYRRLGKLHSAMTSLKRALELEKRLEKVRNTADTQLNMCAVLSQLGKHQEALEHAQEALIALQEGFIQGKHTTDNAAADSTADPSSVRLDRISVMCIAYHNVGVEQEFLKDFAESVVSYKKGVGLAEQYLGADHSITTTIRNSYLAAKRTMATKARVRPCSAQKSPGKTGARLLLSPRTGSLRMPSPLAKEKDRQGSQIPTPRSIIADALSRAPLSALPPLEIQSPPSAGKKKKKKVDAREAKSALSPTDPFFSPRFRFENDAAESKPKKLASITSPRSTAATGAEVQTPPSSKGKRERRKSSAKKPPVTAQTAEAVDERMAAAPTAGSGEEDFNSSAVAPQTTEAATDTEATIGAICRRQSDVVPIDDPSVQDVPAMDTEAEEVSISLQTATPGEAVQPNMGSPRLSDKQSDLSGKETHSGEEGLDNGSLKPSAESDAGERELNETFADPGADSVEAAISMILTSLVEQVAEHANALLDTDAIVEDDTGSIREEALDEPQSSYAPYIEHPVASPSLDGRAELRTESYDSGEAMDSGEVDEESNSGSINDCEAPPAETVEDAVDDSEPTEEDTPEHAPDTERAHIEERDHAIAVDAAESRPIINHELVTEGRTDAASPFEQCQGIDDSAAEDIAPHYENTESGEVNEAPLAAEFVKAIENDEETLTREEEPAQGEVLMEAVTESEMARDEAPTFEVLDEVALAASESSALQPTVALGDLGDQASDQQLMASSAEEEASGPSDEAQEECNASDSGEGAYYGEEIDVSTEAAGLDVETSEHVFQDVYHGEGDVEDRPPFEQEFVFQNEQLSVDYEQPTGSHEDVEAYGEDQQDWSHEDQREPVPGGENVPEYGEYYQEPPETSVVEQQRHDDNTATTANSVAQTPHGGESAAVQVEPPHPDVAIE